MWGKKDDFGMKILSLIKKVSDNRKLVIIDFKALFVNFCNEI